MRPGMGSLGGIVLLLALVPQGAGAGEEVAPGTPIVSVRVVRHDVFDLDDPETSAWPYRWVDALHVVTREEFIRRLLLFRAGDLLDPLQLAESELILRGTGFLNPVTISARPVPGGAEVTVETRDQWTTSVRAGFGMSGDRRSVSVGLSEDNVLGLGKSLLFDVSSDPERTSTTFRYEDITFLGGRWQRLVVGAFGERARFRGWESLHGTAHPQPEAPSPGRRASGSGSQRTSARRSTARGSSHSGPTRACAGTTPTRSTAPRAAWRTRSGGCASPESCCTWRRSA